MLVELAIIPLGGDTHLSDELAEVLEVVHASGLPYELTPSGTCIEGEWGEVMATVRRCHDRARERSPHVITTIKIEDDAGERDKLHRNVASVDEKAGHPLGRQRPAPADARSTAPATADTAGLAVGLVPPN
jgi:uncharacterized protein (TIGR00106 family)